MTMEGIIFGAIMLVAVAMNVVVLWAIGSFVSGVVIQFSTETKPDEE